MAVFIFCATSFAWRTYVRYKLRGRAIDVQPLPIAAVRNSTPVLLFFAALMFSTLCIFIRCCFRVAELSGGWAGPLMQNQVLFIVFESVMVFLAGTALAIFHPCWCLRSILESEGGLHVQRLRDMRSFVVRPFCGNRPRANAISEGSQDDEVLRQQASQQINNENQTSSARWQISTQPQPRSRPVLGLNTVIGSGPYPAAGHTPYPSQ